MFTRRPQTDGQKMERINDLYSRSKSGHFPNVEDVTMEGLAALREAEEVVLVDVRNPPEQEVSMIPGAITAAELEADPEPYSGKTFVTYCTVGHRSGLYAQKLAAEGHRAVNLAGAILAWTHAGGELIDGNGPTQRVHVGGPKWSLEADGYEPVW